MSNFIKKTGYLTDSEIKEIGKKRSNVYFPTNYNFLMSHRGHRPGCLHLYLGTSGCGKSTLVRSILVDSLKFASEDVKILVWLSEEGREDFLFEVSKIIGDSRDKMKQVTVLSELSVVDKIESPQARLEFLFENLMQGYDLVIFDNITTSQFYCDKRYDTQADFAIELKHAAEETESAFILVAHTKDGVYDSMNRLIDITDIRGGKSIVNILNFYYIIQRFEINNSFYPTIRILKHRGQRPEHRLYRLVFDPVTEHFSKDVALDFKEFKEAFKERNHL